MTITRLAILLALTAYATFEGNQLSSILLLNLNAAVAMSVLARTAFGPNRQIFGAAMATVAGIFVSFRSMLGEFNLGFLPQGYSIESESLGQLDLIAQLSVAFTLVTYASLNAVLPTATDRSAERKTEFLPTIPIELVRRIALLLVTLRLALQTVGVGVKGTVSSLPFGANLFTLVDIFTPLSILALLVDGFASGSIRKTRLAISVLALDAVVISLGGTRGGVVDAGLLLAYAYFGTGGRLDARSLVKALGVVASVLVGLNFAIGRRLEVSGGQDFGLIDFLLFRLPGFHRFAPVVDSDLRLGWLDAVQPTAVKELVYQLPPESPTGIGTSWPGIGYLASGVTGMAIVGVLFGILAFAGDRSLLRVKTTSGLTLLIYLAGFASWSYSGARPRVEVRELVVLLAVALIWNFRRSQKRPERPEETPRRRNSRRSMRKQDTPTDVGAKR